MFFTAEDERARIRGSVDPLGLLPVWSAFGRDIVCNLTTVSSSVRGFSVLLIGRHLAADLLARGKIADDDVLPVFLRFEQISAYVREFAHKAGGDVRGIERVRRYSRELEGKIPIGLPQKGEILGDQRTYGLWGLFSVPARASGLLPAGPAGLEPFAQDFVEAQYIPHLKPALSKIEGLLLSPGTILKLDKRDKVCAAVADALPRALRPTERVFFAETLRDAKHGDTSEGVPGRQAVTAELLRARELLDHEVDRRVLDELEKAARTRGEERLATRLRKILLLEALIAPADRLFGYLCARNGHSLEELARKLGDHWQGEPLPHLTSDTWAQIGPEFDDRMGSEIGQCARRALEGFQSAKWALALQALLDWNALVMRGRKGFPWIGLTNGKLDVRFRDDERLLPTRDELPQVWRNSYFIDSLRSITRQLEAS